MDPRSETNRLHHHSIRRGGIGGAAAEKDLKRYGRRCHPEDSHRETEGSAVAFCASPGIGHAQFRRGTTIEIVFDFTVVLITGNNGSVSFVTVISYVPGQLIS
jgi:hypothetical protein